VGVDLSLDLGVDFEVGLVRPSDTTDAPTGLTHSALILRPRFKEPDHDDLAQSRCLPG